MWSKINLNCCFAFVYTSSQVRYLLMITIYLKKGS